MRFNLDFQVLSPQGFYTRRVYVIEGSIKAGGGGLQVSWAPYLRNILARILHKIRDWGASQGEGWKVVVLEFRV